MPKKQKRNFYTTASSMGESIALEFDVGVDKGFQLYFNNDTYAVDWNDTDDFADGYWYNANVLQQFVDLSSNETDINGNNSGNNYTEFASTEEMVVMMKMLVMAVVLGLMILITIIGKFYDTK